MSTDEDVTKDVLATLEDGKDGYAKGADKLAELKEPALEHTFRGFADERGKFADELQQMANSYGDDPKRSGTVAAALHRGWMSLKDALTKDSPKAILETAQQGDEHAVTDYEKALDQEISAELRAVLERQLVVVRAACSTVTDLAAKAA
jgi:uncharacterized protein (TIGR02284 family)